MELLPATRAASSVFRGGPLAFADKRQTRAVDDEMDGFVGRNAVKLDRQVLAPPRERGVIWSVEIDTHHGQHRAQEALHLAERQPEDEPKRQRGLHRVI